MLIKVSNPKAKKATFECSVSSDAKEKHAQQKSAPVKQSEHRVQNFGEPELSSKKDDQKVRQRIIPVKQIEDQGQNSTERVGTMKKQSSSPPKSSKLPPVCLRVDPLPKKKNGNGNCRFPSPPTCEGESSRTVEECAKLPASPNSKKEEPDKSGTKTKSETHLDATGRVKEITESDDNPEKEVKKVQSTEDMEHTRGDEAVNRQKPVKKTFSSDEAATVIQSRYCGYEVRRWEPLKKLKLMMKIRERTLDVKSCIQAIEGSTDHQNCEKEIAGVGEMVMSLLLQLDAIQGIHPSIRDVRKSLAKELLSLQEKLDSLKKSRAMMEDVSIAKQVDTTDEAVEDKTYSETSEIQLAEKYRKVSDPITEESADPLPSPSEPLLTVENETSQQVSSSKEEEPKLVEISVQNQEEDTAQATETQDEPSICDSDATAEAVISEVLEEDTTTPSVNPPSAEEEETTMTGNEKVEFVEASLELMKELPQHVEGNENPTQEVDENENAEAVAIVLENTDSSLLSKSNAELLELPIGVIEEQQDSSHAEVQKSSPCTLEASTDTPSEPVMVQSDSEPDTEVDQQKQEETNNNNEDTTVTEGDNSVEVGHLRETPENIDGGDGDTVKSETLCQETDMSQDADQSNDRLEAIELNDQSGGITEENTIMDAETDMAKVEGGEVLSTEARVMAEETLGGDKKLMEENQRLREAMEKLMEAGREELEVITSLNNRVKTLEKKLSRKKKLQPGGRSSRQYCGKLVKKRIKSKGPNSAAVM